MKTLVLGSGITALAYLHYDREAFALAGDKPGGLFAQKAMGPQYVWVTKYTRQFMQELELTPKVRRIRVGYCLGDKIYSAEEIKTDRMEEIRKQYAEKTRGSGPQSSHMSSGKGNFEVFDIGVGDLVRILLARLQCRIIHQKANHVSLYDHEVTTDHRVWEYDKLVSTIPAPALMDISNTNPFGFEAFDKAYEFADGYDWIYAESNHFDYVYFPEGQPYHRVSLVDRANRKAVVREYTIKPGIRVPKEVVLHPKGQIVGGGAVLQSLPPSVELLGRYAEWRHDRRLEDVLEMIG